MSERSDRLLFGGMAGVAVLLFLAGLVAELVGALTGHKYEVPHVVYYGACVLGFSGFYGLDPKRAKDGGAFIVKSFVDVVAVVRSGRRSTDVRAIVTTSDERKGVNFADELAKKPEAPADPPADKG